MQYGYSAFSGICTMRHLVPERELKLRVEQTSGQSAGIAE